MRIFKGSSITLELPVHVCGAGNFSIEKVVIYTTDSNNAVEFRNHMLIDETLHVYVNADSLNILDEGVINYIVEGDGIHIERMSSYFLKTPKDYTAVSMELEKREVTVTTNNSTTTITKNPQYLGMEEVKVHTEIPLEENKSYEFTENNTSFDIVPDEGYEGIKSGKVSVNIPTQQKYEKVTDNGYFIFVPDEGFLLDRADIEVDIPLEYGKQIYATTNNTAVEIEPSSGYKGVRQGKVYVEIPTQEEKTVNIVKNGTTEVLPDEGYHYIRKVNINTEVTFNSVPIVPSQISFDGSTWEEFDMGEYDWSYVYNWSYVFNNCWNLKRLYNFPQDAKAYGTTDYMFCNCKIEEAPYFDTQFIGSFKNMYDSCSNLTTVPQYDMSNALSVKNMFKGCSSLTSLPQFYCPKLIEADIFYSQTYTKLTDVGGWREIRCNLDLKNLPNLTTQSISNVIEGLYDFDYWAEEPDSTQGTLTLATSLSSVVTEEMMAMATSKKWNIIFK